MSTSWQQPKNEAFEVDFKSTSIISLLACCQDVDRDEVRHDESNRTLAATEVIWAKLRIGRVAKTLEIRSQVFPRSSRCRRRPSLFYLPTFAHKTYFFEECCGEVPSLYGQVSQQPLLVGFLEDVLLDGSLADQPVDVHISGLANAMAPVLRLRVHGRVPVTVVEDDSVCSCQVHAKAATSGWQDEAEDPGVGIEAFHQDL